MKVASSKEREIDAVLYYSATESIPKRLTTTAKLTYCENKKGNCTQDFSDMKPVVRFSGLGVTVISIQTVAQAALLWRKQDNPQVLYTVTSAENMGSCQKFLTMMSEAIRYTPKVVALFPKKNYVVVMMLRQPFKGKAEKSVC